jgi:hypothetical protein
MKKFEDKEADTKPHTVVTPKGVNKLTQDALVVLGLFVRHKNRALAVDEMGTLLDAHQVEVTSDVADVYSELEATGHIKECPLEVHDDGESRYRLSSGDYRK